MTEEPLKLQETAPVAADVMGRITAQLGRRWVAGTRLPGIRLLAEELGIAPGTVVRALDELKQRGVLVARPRLGTFVSHRYTTDQLRQLSESWNPAARSIRPLEGKRIELVYALGAEELVPRMVRALSERVNAEGAATSVTDMSNYGSIETQGPAADAMVVFNPGSETPLRCRPGQVLLVVTSAAKANIGAHERYDVVTVDQEQGGRLAAESLRQWGCEDAVFLGVARGGETSEDRAAYNPTSLVRLNGFRAGWGDRPLQVLLTTTYGSASGAHLARKYAELSLRPRGVFAASDELAVGFLIGALALGMTMGVDYHLIGFDGQSTSRYVSARRLNTVQVPAEEMGLRGAQLLASRLLDPDQPTRYLALGTTLYKGRIAPPLPYEESVFRGQI